MAKVNFLFVGTPSLILGTKVTSSINRTRTFKIRVRAESIDGDQASNLLHHGGPNRVLHQYPMEHYEFWKQLFPSTDFSAGSMGENLSSVGLDETRVCIGDVFQIGGVRGVVTEPRKPCSTINLKFGVLGLARKVQNEAKTGWFFRVLQEGEISEGDSMLLVERPYPTLTIESCVRALLTHPNIKVLEQMAANPILSDNWKNPAELILKTGKIADDRNRLGD